MNSFTYKVYSSVYDEMVSGKKTVEFRLLNEKSEKIKIGDSVKFEVINDSEKFLLVEVTEKFIFENIDELWRYKEILSNNTLNYTKEEFVDTFYHIFGKENVLSSKIVGIQFIVKES